MFCCVLLDRPMEDVVHIVVLEDQPVAALMTRLHLELYGYRVTVTDRLSRLVGVLAPPMPSAFIVDRRLPDGDGLAAVRALRDAGYDGPIVVQSASCTPGDLRDAIDAGADGVLHKPCTAAALMEALLSAERARGRR